MNIIETFEKEVLMFHESNRSHYRRRIGVQLTTACPVECAHCLWSCTSQNAVDFPISILDKCLSQWSEIGGVEVGFTGGEPFFRFNLLKYAIQKATNLGIQPSVATSAYWAKSYEEAMSFLKDLHGLSWLGLSVDQYHLKRIPLQNVINTINAAKSLNIECRILIVLSNSHLKDEMEQLTNHLYHEIKPEMVRIAAMLNYGRAKDINIPKYCDGATPVCGGLDTPLILATGDIFVCCAPSATAASFMPFYRGNINQIPLFTALSEDSEDYWILQCLRAGGPSLVAKLIAQESSSSTDAMSLCDRCLNLFRDRKNYSKVRKSMRNENIQYQIATLLLQSRRKDNTPLIRYIMGNRC